MSLAAAFQNLTKELTELNLESRRIQTFVTTNVAIALFMAISRLVRIPILIQMLAYSLPIIWLGSHLSLDMRVLAQEEKSDNKVGGEILSGRDAALFPIIASVTIFSLYIAFKILPEYWVNLFLSIHIVLAGWWAVHQTIKSSILLGFPDLAGSPRVLSFSPFWPFSREKVNIELSKLNFLATALAGVVAVGWFFTRAWALHNLFAVGFSIQAIHLMSVGNFKTASILLIGLFFYDIFWVFGTEVMVKVAKTFDAPAKLLFPIGKPGEYSILGLGDIVIPGIFVAMTLRFDYWLHEHKSAEKKVDIDTNKKPMFRQFPKFYFKSSMIAYAVSLVTTGVIMLVFKAAQPALLYLVPAILTALYVPALFRRELRKVIEFTEEEEEEEEEESSEDESD